MTAAVVTSPLDRVLDALRARGPVRQAGREWVALCPAHDDHHPSLNVGTGVDGRVVTFCRSHQCTYADVMGALGLDPRAGFVDGDRQPAWTDRAARRYEYRAPDRSPLGWNERQRGTSPKFLPRKLDGTTGATDQLKATLYNGNALRDRPDDTVALVEGENDCDALLLYTGVLAVTNPFGAAAFHAVHARHLAGRRVHVILDRDAAGRRRLDVLRAAGLWEHATVVTVSEPPPPHKDVADLLTSGGLLGDLITVDPGPADLTDEPIPAEPATATPIDTAPTDPLAAAIAAEADRLRVRDAAARLVRRETAADVDTPTLVRLDAFLAVPDPPAVYRIDGLLPVGGRAVLAAQYKAGKTTVRDNLVRALVDGGDFLGRFTVDRPAGRVVIIDDELDERMLRRWLREQGVVHTDRVHVLSLRGRLGTFDLLDPDTRAEWATKLREAGAGFVILDCLRPVLDALGLSEDKDAGRFLVAFDALLAESGLSEALVVHHTGHTGERSRGDSRIRDWPDAEWRLVREQTDNGDQAADARRYFGAYGRDVDVPEGLLDYDRITRRLSLTGGTRQETAADALIPDVLAFLADEPGTSQRGIETEMASRHRHPQRKVRAAVHRGIDLLDIVTRSGPKGATLHYVNRVPSAHSTSSAASAAGVRQRTPSECGSAAIGAALHSRSGDDPAVRQPPHSTIDGTDLDVDAEPNGTAA